MDRKYSVADFHNDCLTEGGDILFLARETASCVCALFRGSRNYSYLRAAARAFRRKHPPTLFLGLEDIGYFERARADELASWNPVYVSLTWNKTNALAGGCMDAGGLTEKGREAVRFFSGKGIAIDCAHLNKESFSDVLGIEKCLPIDSHTCMSGICRHPRNLEDWQVREIVARGGLIGIAFVGKFLREGKAANSADVFCHIDYAVQKFGVQYFCIGSDFNGTDDLPVDLHGYEDLPLLAEMMDKAGYSVADIDKIFRLNLQNFLKNFEE